jgi:Mn-dependent DtxR family transcriptional regulator
MKEKIGEAAGKIWSILREKDELDVTQIPKILKKNDVLSYQALGWLAREGKIEYNKKKNVTFVSLIESERYK